MKKFLMVNIVGIVFFAILFVWFSPQIIIWYYSPPAELAMSCSPAVQWALSTYRKVIIAGVLVGMIVSTIFYFATRSLMGKRKTPNASIEQKN